MAKILIFQKIKNYFPFCHPRGGGGPDGMKRLDLRLRGNDKKKEFVFIYSVFNKIFGCRLFKERHYH